MTRAIVGASFKTGMIMEILRLGFSGDIASKSIVIYRMTWEALSPSPFACTLSGLTRLG